MTPTATILATISTPETVFDDDGRRLSVRRLTALDRLRLFKAAGAELAQNQPWLGMALIASSVVAIDDVPVPPPTNEMQIEAMIGRLGDSGVTAIARALQTSSEQDTAKELDTAGN
jgi:hypothetical protein